MSAVTAEADPKAPSRKPWYREPWPWLLASGPAIVVVAGLTTAVIAFRGADGLVADDYYKQGLAINREIARDEAARALGITGELTLEPGRIRVTLRASATLPDRLTIRLAHPSRASEDRVAHLARTGEGIWEAPLAPLSAAHWTAIVETPQWRISALVDSRKPGPAPLAPGVR